jgi:hypothetical protein
VRPSRPLRRLHLHWCLLRSPFLTSSCLLQNCPLSHFLWVRKRKESHPFVQRKLRHRRCLPVHLTWPLKHFAQWQTPAEQPQRQRLVLHASLAALIYEKQSLLLSYTGARRGISSLAVLSHLACWLNMESTIWINASYEENRP